MARMRPSLIAGPVLFLVGLIGLGVGFFVMRPVTPAMQTSALVGGPFRMIDQDGRAVTEADMKGKPFLVFFGFTHCPDICPAKLFEISQVLNAMGEGSNLEALFITVDPERDTPEAIKRYLSSFNPRIKGLTGDQAAVDGVVKAYRAYAKKVPLDDGSYTMDHTSLVYLMGADGGFVTSVDMTKRDTEIADEIRRRL